MLQAVRAETVAPSPEKPGPGQFEYLSTVLQEALNSAIRKRKVSFGAVPPGVLRGAEEFVRIARDSSREDLYPLDRGYDIYTYAVGAAQLEMRKFGKNQRVFGKLLDAFRLLKEPRPLEASELAELRHLERFFERLKRAAQLHKQR